MELLYNLNNGLVLKVSPITHELKKGKAIIKKDKYKNISLSIVLPFNKIFSDDSYSYEIRFDFPSQYLDEYFLKQPLDYYNFFSDYEEVELCCKKQVILNEIINCKMEGAFRDIFLESKALELLLCFQNCAGSSKCPIHKFLTHGSEKLKILKAKEILLERLSDPPTISELSLQVGINQNYLKKGFKSVVGTTVYGFVNENRMLKAKVLLSKGEFSISQISDDLGFSSVSNFSQAFRKSIGVPPSEFQKQYF